MGSGLWHMRQPPLARRRASASPSSCPIISARHDGHLSASIAATPQQFVNGVLLKLFATWVLVISFDLSIWVFVGSGGSGSYFGFVSCPHVSHVKPASTQFPHGGAMWHEQFSTVAGSYVPSQSLWVHGDPSSTSAYGSVICSLRFAVAQHEIVNPFLHMLWHRLGVCCVVFHHADMRLTDGFEEFGGCIIQIG